MFVGVCRVASFMEDVMSVLDEGTRVRLRRGVFRPECCCHRPLVQFKRGQGPG